MYISKIQLKNIRGFTDLTFDLDRGNKRYAGWTVFTGDNGSGKSTLLKAIAICIVGTDTARSLLPTFRRWVRDGSETEGASVHLEITAVNSDDALSGMRRSSSNKVVHPQVQPKIELTSVGSEAILQEAGSLASRSVSNRSVWSPDALGWFSCGYGPFRRVFGASPEATRQMVAPATERFVTMFQEAASLFEVDQWLRNLKYKALEGKSAEGEQLELLLEILRDDLLPNEISVDRVDSDGLWLKDRNRVHLTWADMSDGYRSALALLADILRHLITTYGITDLTDRDSDGKLFVKRSGVVLIDEIDAHLHPEWQRTIGFWLKRHFPNIQFIVTSHSPIICQAADPNGLFVLPEPGSKDAPRALTAGEYQTVIASRPDTILLSPAFDLQNTRSPRAVDARSEYAMLEAKRRAGALLTQAEQQREDALRPLAVTDEDL